MAKVRSTTSIMIRATASGVSHKTGLDDEPPRIGEAAAQAVLAARRNDGSDFSSDYVITQGNGAYVLTAQAQMLSPSPGKMKPFASQYRPSPPPPIDFPQVFEMLPNSRRSARQPARSERPNKQSLHNSTFRLARRLGTA
jgi:hypothetical protein